MFVDTPSAVVGVERYGELKGGVWSNALFGVCSGCATAGRGDACDGDVVIAVVCCPKDTLHLTTILANMSEVVT